MQLTEKETSRGVGLIVRGTILLLARKGGHFVNVEVATGGRVSHNGSSFCRTGNDGEFSAGASRVVEPDVSISSNSVRVHKLLVGLLYAAIGVAQ